MFGYVWLLVVCVWSESVVLLEFFVANSCCEMAWHLVFAVKLDFCNLKNVIGQYKNLFVRRDMISLLPVKKWFPDINATTQQLFLKGLAMQSVAVEHPFLCTATKAILSGNNDLTYYWVVMPAIGGVASVCGMLTASCVGGRVNLFCYFGGIDYLYCNAIR